MAKCYSYGLGVTQNHLEAIKLYTIAAGFNHLKSEICLADYYYDGIYIPKNYGKALFWYKKASQHYSQHARERIKELSQQHSLLD